MELWTEVRRRLLTGEIGKREACRQYPLHWQTHEKILGHVEPSGYRRAKSRQRPKMEPFLPRIAQILESDRRAPQKQRHTAKRVFDRLVAEHAWTSALDFNADVQLMSYLRRPAALANTLDVG